MWPHQRIEKDEKGCALHALHTCHSLSHPYNPLQYLQSTHGVHAQLIYRFCSLQVLQVTELAKGKQESLLLSFWPKCAKAEMSPRIRKECYCIHPRANVYCIMYNVTLRYIRIFLHTYVMIFVCEMCPSWMIVDKRLMIVLCTQSWWCCYWISEALSQSSLPQGRSVWGPKFRNASSCNL